MRPLLTGTTCGVAALLGFTALALLLGGCGSLAGTVRVDSSLLAAQSSAATEDETQVTTIPEAIARDTVPETRVGDDRGPAARSDESTAAIESVAMPPTPAPAAVLAVAAAEGDDVGPTLVQLQRAPGEKIPPKGEDEIEEEYDPWEKFNEPMFEFNRKLDKYVLKPVAKGYNVVMPEPFQLLISNGFDNLNWIPRFVNSLLQAKWRGAASEMGRFLINSTLGIGGLFDAAKYWGIEKSREDFGQTLAVWGAGPGPYLILPFLEPMTVRDGIGKAVDGAMDPLSYVLPFIWTRLGMSVGNTVNDRALNIELFQGFEESVIDMYSAVRNAYLRRREQLIKE